MDHSTDYLHKSIIAKLSSTEAPCSSPVLDCLRSLGVVEGGFIRRTEIHGRPLAPRERDPRAPQGSRRWGGQTSRRRVWTSARVHCTPLLWLKGRVTEGVAIIVPALYASFLSHGLHQMPTEPQYSPRPSAPRTTPGHLPCASSHLRILLLAIQKTSASAPAHSPRVVGRSEVPQYLSIINRFFPPHLLIHPQSYPPPPPPHPSVLSLLADPPRLSVFLHNSLSTN